MGLKQRRIASMAGDVIALSVFLSMSNITSFSFILSSCVSCNMFPDLINLFTTSSIISKLVYTSSKSEYPLCAVKFACFIIATMSLVAFRSPRIAQAVSWSLKLSKTITCFKIRVEKAANTTDPSLWNLSQTRQHQGTNNTLHIRRIIDQESESVHK